MSQCIVGWDIGGAHLKAAVLEPSGMILNIFQVPCPLWKGIEFLNQAVCQILNKISEKNCKHVITMTGELVDLFENRDQGVAKIILTMQENLPANNLTVYAGLNGFLNAEEIVPKHYEAIASVNWLASASWAASQLKSGMFIDVGSTTTDILVLAQDKVQTIGLTDYERMVSGELVYSGIIRTAVMAVTRSVFFKGKNMGIMAEYFATMADVYRLTGELNEAHDQTDTADGADKTKLASAKRLSRMTGYEFAENDMSIWEQLAQNIKMQQKYMIQQACERQLSRQLISKSDYFIGAGVGRFLIKQIAECLGYPYLDFAKLLDNQNSQSDMNVADCAPAVSVALLMASH